MALYRKYKTEDGVWVRETVGGKRTVTRLAPRQFTLSSVGTKLHAIIKRETDQEVPCDDCAKEIDKLDMMLVEDAVMERDRVVGGIYGRAWEHASWKDRIKLLADKALTVSSFGRKHVGESIIGGWFDEAIDTGAKPIEKKNDTDGNQEGPPRRRSAGCGCSR